MKVHIMRAWPQSFEPQVDGLKHAEFRRDDRGVAVGDYLILREWDPAAPSDPVMGQYSGYQCVLVVTHVVRGPDFAIPEGYALFSTTLVGGEQMANVLSGVAEPEPATP